MFLDGVGFEIQLLGGPGGDFFGLGFRFGLGSLLWLGLGRERFGERIVGGFDDVGRLGEGAFDGLGVAGFGDILILPTVYFQRLLVRYACTRSFFESEEEADDALCIAVV